MKKNYQAREQRKAQTRETILKAARLQFAQVGVDATTMDQIADRANVVRATVFNHFPNKGAIVAELAGHMNEAFLAMVQRHAHRENPVRDRIQSLFAEIGRTLEERPNYFRPLVIFWERTRGEAAEIVSVAHLNEAMIDLLGAPGREGLREDVDVGIAAELLVSTQIEFIHNWRMRDDYPLTARLTEAARLLSDSLAPATMRAATV